MPLMEISAATALDLHAAIIATLLAPEPVHREQRHWLADGVRRNRLRIRARQLANEGHPTAPLMAQIAVCGSHDRPADENLLAFLWAKCHRDLLIAAHIAAVLLIATEVDRERATLKLARESFRLRYPDLKLEDRTLRGIWRVIAPSAPLALAYAGVEFQAASGGRANEMAKEKEYREILVLTEEDARRLENGMAEERMYRDILALTGKIACCLTSIATRVSTPLFDSDLFWRPPLELVRGIKVEPLVRLERRLLDAVLEGKVDPVRALHDITACLPRTPTLQPAGPASA